MLVPFGTHVVDREGKSVGTVSRLVLDPLSEEVVALVVQQGVLNRREVVVPINKVVDFGKEVRLSLRASELAGLDLFNAQPLKPMPDHWKMPLGFDQRSLFLVAGDGWTTAVLPFVLTSPRVSGTPAYIPDPDAHVDPEPAIAVATPVWPDHAHHRAARPPLPYRDGHPREPDRVDRRHDHARRERRRGEEARALADRPARAGALSSAGRMIGYRPSAFTSALVSSFLLVALLGCQRHEESAAQTGPPPMEVAVTTVSPRALPVSFDAVGQTAGPREVEVRARVGGILQEQLRP